MKKIPDYVQYLRYRKYKLESVKSLAIIYINYNDNDIDDIPSRYDHSFRIILEIFYIIFYLSKLRRSTDKVNIIWYFICISDAVGYINTNFIRYTA